MTTTSLRRALFGSYREGSEGTCFSVSAGMIGEIAKGPAEVAAAADWLNALL